jgi:3-oxoacyl-[acyl-carrier protein] reductase
VTETEGVSGRSAVVTGGNKGIGAAIVAALLGEGHRVASFSRGGDAPEGALGIACDVTDPAAVDAAFKQAEEANGPVEILVANSGVTKDTLILRMSDADWDLVMETNLKGAFRCAKRASSKMLRAKWGRMIFISSVVGLYGGPGQVNYAASKAGLVGMARSITRELGSRNITANVVAPGFIETEMTAVLPDARKAEIIKAVPAGRLATADEVAAAVTFLAGDSAAYISGAVLPVDGGLGMGH